MLQGLRMCRGGLFSLPYYFSSRVTAVVKMPPIVANHFFLRSFFVSFRETLYISVRLLICVFVDSTYLSKLLEIAIRSFSLRANNEMVLSLTRNCSVNTATFSLSNSISFLAILPSSIRATASLSVALGMQVVSGLFGFEFCEILA